VRAGETSPEPGPGGSGLQHVIPPKRHVSCEPSQEAREREWQERCVRTRHDTHAPPPHMLHSQESPSPPPTSPHPHPRAPPHTSPHPHPRAPPHHLTPTPAHIERPAPMTCVCVGESGEREGEGGGDRACMHSVLHEMRSIPRVLAKVSTSAQRPAPGYASLQCHTRMI